MEENGGQSPSKLESSLFIQRLWRGFCARRICGDLAQEIIEKVYDPKSRAHYFYNKRLDQSRWTVPLFLKLSGRDIDNVAPTFTKLQAAAKIQRFLRLLFEWEDDGNGIVSKKTSDSSSTQTRNYPRSLVQHLVDDAEDSNYPSVTLNLSSLSLKRVSSRIYDMGSKIASLNLSRNNLSRISPDISDLHCITSLDVSYNRLTRIPGELEGLTSLRVLNISHNCIEKYPTCLYKLRLDEWNLSHNKIDAIHSEEGNLQLLKDTKQWELGIGFMTSLKTLNASNNKISHFPKQLEQCCELVFLDLSFNDIDQIPNEAGQLRKLKRVFVQGNRIKSLPQNCTKWPVEELEANDNIMSKLPRIMSGWNKTLWRISFNNCNLRELPDGVVDLKSVQEFSASNSNIKRVSQNIGAMHRLKKLTINSNKLSDFPHAINECRALKCLMLSHNMFRTVPSGISLLFKLTYLDMSYNKLESLCGLGSLVSLMHLNFSRNCIAEIDKDVFRLESLEYFNLSHNRLSSIPNDVGRLHRLKVFDVSHNKISVFPQAVMGLSYLHTMELNNNCLAELSEGIHDLKELRKLGLHCNRFIVRPPICGMEKVSHFNLGNNPMSGTLTLTNIFHEKFAEICQELSKLCYTKGHHANGLIEKASSVIELATQLKQGTPNILSLEVIPAHTHHFQLAVLQMMAGKLCMHLPNDNQDNGEEVGKEDGKICIIVSDSCALRPDLDKDESTRWFRKAVKSLTLAEEFFISSGNWHGKGGEIYFNRGFCHYHLNELSAALHDIELSLSIHPHHIPSHILRSRIRLGLGQIPQSVKESKVAMKRAGKQHALYNELVDLHYLSHEAVAGCISYNMGALERTFRITDDGILRRSEKKASYVRCFKQKISKMNAEAK